MSIAFVFPGQGSLRPGAVSMWDGHPAQDILDDITAGVGRDVRALAEDETVHTVLRVKAFDAESAVFFATRNGTVKKTMLDAFSRPRQAGIWAIELGEGDELVSVGLARPGDSIIIGTAHGKAIHFDEKAARSMGRQARGVRGIKLLGDDKVVDMLVAHDPEGTVLTACEKGFGKRTPVKDYPVKNRGGQGVINIKTTERNGKVVGLARCKDGDDVVLMTKSGMIVRSPVADMRPMGRNTAGVRIINLKEDDLLVGAEIVDSGDLELVDEGEQRPMDIDRAEEAAALAEKAEEEPEDDEPAEDEGDTDEDEE